MFYKIFVVTLSVFLILIIETYAKEKYCRLRGTLVPRETWNHKSGYGCYYYISEERLKFIYNITYILYENDSIPVSGTDNEQTNYFWYDVYNETSLSYIKLSFKTNLFFQKWKSCAIDAVDCCDNFMNEDNIYSSDAYPCPAIWDSWSCFKPSKPNTIQRVRCPEMTFSAESVCSLKSEKECFSDGTWNQTTNYATCAIAIVLRNRHSFHAIVLGVAIIFSLPSVVIFFRFRALRNSIRFILHRNLIIVIIIRNILTIITKEVIILGYLNSLNTVMEDNGLGCRILVFFENVSKNAMFACMLADGYYLHQLIVRPFADNPNMLYLYLVITVLSFGPSLIWALLRGLHNGGQCWMVDETTDHWIPDSFRFFILGINLILLIDIIRVMISKIKYSSITEQAKTTFRATLFLIPLFGIHIIIMSNRNMVINDTCTAEDAYYYTSYLFEALQGIMVALLFCYINSEVRELILNGLRKLSLVLPEKCKTKKLNKYKRRSTAATFVGSIPD